MPQSYVIVGSTKLTVVEAEITCTIKPPPERTVAIPTKLSGEFTAEFRWEPGAWLDLLCRTRYGVSFAELVEALECRRWFSRGGPLASWYRTRPGWRVADGVETGRN